MDGDSTVAICDEVAASLLERTSPGFNGESAAAGGFRAAAAV